MVNVKFTNMAREYKDERDVAANAWFEERGKVIKIESGIAIPISIHGGCQNGVLSITKTDGYGP